MKKTKSVLLGLIAGIALFLLSVSAQAITIGFEPVWQDVMSGDTAVVDLVIFGLGDGVSPSLGSFDIDVTFESSILALDTTDVDMDSVIDSVVLDPTPNLIGGGTQLDIFGLGGNFVSAGLISPGVLNISDVSLDFPLYLKDYQADTFTLATLTFDTIGLGLSSLGLANVILGDEYWNPLAAVLNTASVNVNSNPVPEPTTMLLFGIGLAGLAALRRKKEA